MRNFVVSHAVQRSPEWHQMRLGRLTGSRAKDMLATIKSGEAAARRDLRMQLVCERLTGQVQEDGYVNDVMQRGIELEPAAFAAYEGVTGLVAERSGFLAHTEHWAGCSLDGHIGDFEGILELKCPKSATHLRYLKSDQIPAEHLPQIMHNLWITGAAWCDFVSFDDRFPQPLQVVRIRYERTEDAIAAYARAALAFLKEVETEVESVRTLAVLTSVMKEAMA